MSNPIDPAAAGPPIDAEPDLADQARALLPYDVLLPAELKLNLTAVRLEGHQASIDRIIASHEALRVKLAEAADENRELTKSCTVMCDDVNRLLARLAAVEAERDDLQKHIDTDLWQKKAEHAKRMYHQTLDQLVAERAARLAAEQLLAQLRALRDEWAEVDADVPNHGLWDALDEIVGVSQ